MSAVDCPPIVFAAGASQSNPVYADLVYDDAESLLISNPSSMPSVTFTIQTGRYDSRAVIKQGITQEWSTLTDGTNPIAHNPAASQSVAYPKFPGKAFRLVASGSVGGGGLTLQLSKVALDFGRL